MTKEECALRMENLQHKIEETITDIERKVEEATTFTTRDGSRQSYGSESSRDVAYDDTKGDREYLAQLRAEYEALRKK